MKIGIIGGCGGLGKTTLALTIAKEMDAYLITNDPTNPLGKVYKDFKYTNPMKIIDNNNFHFVYDFAGHMTPEMTDAAKKCDLIILITDNTTHAVNGANLLLSNLKCKDIFMINNFIGQDGYKYKTTTAYHDFKRIKNAFSTRYKDLDILPLRFTSLAKFCIDNGDSLLDRTITKKGNINKLYTLENAQLKEIINRIKNKLYTEYINKIQG